MTFPDHPLADVFSEADLQRLQSGLCLGSGGQADDNIAGMLTSDYYSHPDSYNVPVAKWLRQASLHGDHVHRDYRARLRSSVSDRSAFLQVTGELMVAFLLEKQMAFDLRFVPRRQARTPDFEISKDSVDLAVEVKTVVRGLPMGLVRYAGLGFDAAPAVRDAMDSARGQLRKDAANVVMIADCWRPPINQLQAIDALYGDLELRIPIPTEPNAAKPEPYEVRERNVMCQIGKNTRIGAVGFVAWTGAPDVQGYVIHNVWAASPIPTTVFDPCPQLIRESERVDSARILVWRNRQDRA